MRIDASTQGRRRAVIDARNHVLGGTPAEFATVLRNDIRKWAKLAAGLKLQLD